MIFILRETRTADLNMLKNNLAGIIDKTFEFFFQFTHIPKISCTIFCSCGCDMTRGDEGDPDILAAPRFLCGELAGPPTAGTTGTDMVDTVYHWSFSHCSTCN